MVVVVVMVVVGFLPQPGYAHLAASCSLRRLVGKEVAYVSDLWQSAWQAGSCVF